MKEFHQCEIKSKTSEVLRLPFINTVSNVFFRSAAPLPCFHEIKWNEQQNNSGNCRLVVRLEFQYGEKWNLKILDLFWIPKTLRGFSIHELCAAAKGGFEQQLRILIRKLLDAEFYILNRKFYFVLSQF